MASYKKKTLAEIDNPPPPLAHVSLSRKSMPDQGGHPQDFDINISNKPNIYLTKNYIYGFQIAFISKT